jgi:hypothetical protein
MDRWEDNTTARARADVQRLIEVGVGRVKEALEADAQPALFALGLNRDGSLRGTMWARPDGVPLEDGAQSLCELLADMANELWAGVVLLDPGDEGGISVMSFEGAHREGPPFHVIVPWQRTPDGRIATLAVDITPGSLAIFD